MKAIEKELQRIKKSEKRLCRQAEKKTEPLWNSKLEEKIPEKVMTGLQKAFSKAFYLIFEKGSAVIEMTYDKESVEKEFQIKDYAMDIKGGRKEINQMKWDATGGNAINLMITTAEGIGLGALGIGIPDIAIWVGILLRGVYETAMKYGFDYESPEEKVFILKMLETAMLTDEAWTVANETVDAYIEQDVHAIPENDVVRKQIEKTAEAFAFDMLVAKFIQGLPVVGMLGGAANPVYYHKVMSYVQLKYRKRYLIGKMRKAMQ